MFKFIKWSILATFLLVILTTGTLFILHKFYFNETATYISKIVEKKTGINIKFKEARGDLFKGQLTLKDFSLKSTHPISEFNFECSGGELSTNLNLAELFTLKKINIEKINISSFKGNINKAVKEEKVANKEKLNTNPKSTEIKEFKDLIISNINIKNSHLKYSENNHLQHNIDIKKLSSPRVRGDYIVYDLLFNSDMDVEIDNFPVIITVNNISSNEKEINWTLKDIPLDMVPVFFRVPILEGKKSGIIVAKIHEKREGKTINSKWDMTLKGINLRLAGGLIPTFNLGSFLSPLKKILSIDESINFYFSVTLDEKQYHKAIEGDANEFKEIISHKIQDKLIEKIITQNSLNIPFLDQLTKPQD